MVAGLISKTLSEVHPTLRTNGMGIGNTHRRISLGFLPVNKKNPLVRKYRRRQGRSDLRSYQSLGEDFGSNVREENLLLNGDIDEEDLMDETDGGELSRTISLPSRVSETPDFSQLDNDWILQEHERRYSSAYNSEPEEQEELENLGRYPGRELDYDEFMQRLQIQKQIHENEHPKFHMHNSRRPSFVSVTSRGTVPIIYEEYHRGESPNEILRTESITFDSEAKVIASYSFPLIFTFLLEQMFPMVCSLTVGHLGSNELAAVSLASMTSNITLAIFEGIATSLDTLCPQAYGSGRYYSVGIHLQRCIAFSLFVFIPFAIFWYYSEHVLSLVVPEKELVALTAKFLRVLILGAPGYIFFENLKRFLQAQGIFDAGIYVLSICAPLNVLLSYTLVWNSYIGVGFVGAAIAVAINFWMMFILLCLYTVYVQGKECWGGFTKKAFTHWGDLARLAISGIIMLEAEELSYELLTLFSAYFGTSYLAAQSAVSTTAALLYMVPFAIGISTSTRIANFIGAKRADLANISSRVGLAFSFAAGLTNCCILVFGRHFVAKIFSRDEAVLRLMSSLLPLVGIVQNFDSLNAVAGACLRGQGMQALGSIVNLVVYYVIAIPLGMVLSYFLDLKLYGLWIGIGIGMLLIGLIESYYVLFPDWEGILNYAEMLKETEDDDDSDLESDYMDSDEEPDETSPLI
ncbi:BN860_03224g1_1 [Zygosaccharomyces bailii CLIB 213]|uniref:BN860_03224g1_1 n=1 Tax=Zygosaccharomyces bailii (strain CLIB 213 / ATCC 58445 / CBS 680 / BCRC 21525 / NBRC 1098 / NCYC 1416 / NRRL Y-2227) TaxID=1333698 RepID=A0A8J2X4H6_ZYGB2|nr:BN860_03224g1_1 [Zygosaccharomyces bailii CLIB 213]